VPKDLESTDMLDVQHSAGHDPIIAPTQSLARRENHELDCRERSPTSLQIRSIMDRMTRRNLFAIAGGLATGLFKIGGRVKMRTVENLITVEIQPRRSVITAYKDGAVVASTAILIGGDHFINDLAYLLRRHSPPQWAPELAETVGILPPGARYGSVSSARGRFEQVFSARRYDVVEALEARAIEFAEFLRDGLEVVGLVDRSARRCFWRVPMPG
jgi:hypothetical protein